MAVSKNNMIMSRITGKYKKIVIDILLTLLATGIPLLVLQLVILPLLATKMGEEEYGAVLTIVSGITVVSGGFGGALNNIRLIKQNDYEKSGQQGDFNLILLCEVLICSGLTGVMLGQFQLKAADYIWVILLAVLWLAREYFVVIFRIQLNFVNVVFNNVVVVAGYIAGYLLFLMCGYWQLIYLVGMVFSLVHVAKKSEIIREGLTVTPLIKTTVKDLGFLTIAGVANSLLSYADRLIVYPLIGGAAVSVYYVSTLLGKVVGTAVQPFSTVALSYLAKKGNVEKSTWGQTVLISGIIAFVGYFASLLAAYPVLNLIYPQWIQEAMELLPITTATAMVSMVISIFYAFILKMCSMKWQLVINASVLVVYLGLSVVMYRLYGMVGFCVGVLLSHVVKLVIMLILGFKAAKAEE